MPHSFPERTASGSQLALNCELRLPGYPVDHRALLVDERSHTERRRARADHRDSCTTELREIAMREAVRQQFRRNMMQFRRDVLEVADSYGNGHASCRQFLVVLEFQAKATGSVLEG